MRIPDRLVDRRAVIELVPGLDDVAGEKLGLLPDGQGGDAALGVIGVGARVVLALGDQEHVDPPLGQAQGGGGAGDAAADDQHIGFQVIFHL